MVFDHYTNISITKKEKSTNFFFFFNRREKYELLIRFKHFIFAGFADPLKVCCGYHVNYTHVWCGTKASINGSKVYGASCKVPSTYVSWDGVHYSQGASQWIANHVLNGALTDPPTSITQSCHRH